MLFENSTSEGKQLFSYNVASGDMRFIEIAERTLFVRYDSEKGLLIRGEVPGSGPSCYVNLSHVLLEYVMGCEDCRQAKLMAEAAERFGRRLGNEFIEFYCRDREVQDPTEALADAVTIIVNSLGVAHNYEFSEDCLRFVLAHCPLHAMANKEGLALWVGYAHRALVFMLDTVLNRLAPSWMLQLPAERQSEMPLREISFSRS